MEGGHLLHNQDKEVEEEVEGLRVMLLGCHLEVEEEVEVLWGLLNLQEEEVGDPLNH